MYVPKIFIIAARIICIRKFSAQSLFTINKQNSINVKIYEPSIFKQIKLFSTAIWGQEFE